MPRFVRPTIKKLRVDVTSDGRLTPIPRNVQRIDEDAWWSAVLEDPRGRGKALDYDTLWYNREDTADLSCDDCKMSRSVTMQHLLVMGFDPAMKRH